MRRPVRAVVLLVASTLVSAAPALGPSPAAMAGPAVGPLSGPAVGPAVGPVVGPPRIETIAGSLGRGPAQNLAVVSTAVAVLGNSVLIADASANVVRRVDLGTGLASIFAGNGSGFHTGFGGPATEAGIGQPVGVSVGPTGNVYISGMSQVLKVDPTGHITVLAGNGSNGDGGDGGPAVDATFRQPVAAVEDLDGNVFIADVGWNRVRRVDPDGDIWAVASFPKVVGLAVHPDGSLYIAAKGANRIYRRATDGTTTIVAGNGTCAPRADGVPATATAVCEPEGVAVGPMGTVYIGETSGHIVSKVEGGTISRIAGGGDGGLDPEHHGDGGPALDSMLLYPEQVAVSPTTGEVFVPDFGHRRVRRIAGGTITTIAGNGAYGAGGDGGDARDAVLRRPSAVRFGPDGSIYVAARWDNQVRRIAPDRTISRVAGLASGESGITGDGPDATKAPLDEPGGVAIGADGSIYISDTGNHRIRRVSPSGQIVTIAGNGDPGFSGDGAPAGTSKLNAPRGLDVDGDGNVYVADSGNNRIRKITPAFLISTVAGGGIGGDGPATAAGLATPYDVVVDGDGLLIADSGHSKVRRVDASQMISTVAGNGSAARTGDHGPATAAGIGVPLGVTRDPFGAVLITDSIGNVVRRVAPSGTITTLVGGSTGSAGDGGPAAHAQLRAPSGITTDRDANVLIADAENNKIRRVAPAPQRYVALAPTRVVDTRSGIGGNGEPWGPGEMRTVPFATGVLVPPEATSVVLNLTVTGATEASHLTAWPSATTMPATSNVNFAPATTVANLVTVGISGQPGSIDVHNNAGSVDVIIDLVGYEVPAHLEGLTFAPVPPVRVLDSRSGAGGIDTPWTAGATRTVPVGGAGGAVPADATAVMVNLTATDVGATTHLTAWATGTAKPDTSNLNAVAGQTVANLSVVPLDAGGRFDIYNNDGAVHVIADVVGYFRPAPAGSGFHALAPIRAVDSRDGTGTPAGPWEPTQTRVVELDADDAVPSGATAVLVNLTAVGATEVSHLVAWPTGSLQPTTSNLNQRPGVTVANLSLVPVPPDRRVNIYNNSGSVDVVVDVLGYVV